MPRAFALFILFTWHHPPPTRWARLVVSFFSFIIKEKLWSRSLTYIWSFIGPSRLQHVTLPTHIHRNFIDLIISFPMYSLTSIYLLPKILHPPPPFPPPRNYWCLLSFAKPMHPYCLPPSQPPPFFSLPNYLLYRNGKKLISTQHHSSRSLAFFFDSQPLYPFNR